MIKMLATLAVICLARNASGAAFNEYYEEKFICIKRGDSFDKDNGVRIRTSDKVTLKIKLYENAFFNALFIRANASVTKRTNQIST